MSTIPFSNDEGNIKVFLSYADWLVNNLTMIDAQTGLWRYMFDYFPYLEKSPWVSSMAQGRGIQVLLRAYLLTSSSKYLDAAGEALKAYSVTYENGGIRQLDGDGNVCYEEYPGKPTSHVLNGFIFSLWGLHDY